MHTFLCDFPWLGSSHFNHHDGTTLDVLLRYHLLLYCNIPSLVKSPEHPWVVWFPCFHIALAAGLQKPMAITSFSTAPAVITHTAATGVLGRSCSETNQKQTCMETPWSAKPHVFLQSHQRRAICFYPGCRNAVMGRYHTKCRYTFM